MLGSHRRTGRRPGVPHRGGFRHAQPYRPGLLATQDVKLIRCHTIRGIVVTVPPGRVGLGLVGGVGVGVGLGDCWLGGCWVGAGNGGLTGAGGWSSKSLDGDEQGDRGDGQHQGERRDVGPASGRGKAPSARAAARPASGPGPPLGPVRPEAQARARRRPEPDLRGSPARAVRRRAWRRRPTTPPRTATHGAISGSSSPRHDGGVFVPASLASRTASWKRARA